MGLIKIYLGLQQLSNEAAEPILQMPCLLPQVPIFVVRSTFLRIKQIAFFKKIYMDVYDCSVS